MCTLELSSFIPEKKQQQQNKAMYVAMYDLFFIYLFFIWVLANFINISTILQNSDLSLWTEIWGEEKED